jgi:hypothetical protein
MMNRKENRFEKERPSGQRSAAQMDVPSCGQGTNGTGTLGETLFDVVIDRTDVDPRGHSSRDSDKHISLKAIRGAGHWETAGEPRGQSQLLQAIARRVWYTLERNQIIV